MKRECGKVPDKSKAPRRLDEGSFSARDITDYLEEPIEAFGCPKDVLQTIFRFVLEENVEKNLP